MYNTKRHMHHHGRLRGHELSDKPSWVRKLPVLKITVKLEKTQGNFQIVGCCFRNITIPYNHTIPPYHIPHRHTISPYQIIIQYHNTISSYNTTIPYHHTIPPYYITIPYHHISSVSLFLFRDPILFDSANVFAGTKAESKKN